MDSSSKPELRLVDPPGAPDPKKDGIHWDKPAPTAPPGDMKRSVPKHLLKIAEFLGNIVADEAFLLDLCVDRAVEVVNFNCRKRMVGVDLLQDQGQMHPFNIVAAATPLAIELYRESLKSVEQQKDVYAKLLEEAQKEMAGGGKTPTIFVP